MGRVSRWAGRITRLVVPVAPFRRVGRDAMQSRDVIRGAWRELVERAAANRRMVERSEIVVPTPAEAQAIRTNARIVWGVSVLVVLLGLALGGIALNAHSALAAINGFVASAGLLMGGLVKALDAARAVAEVRLMRPLGWREFVGQPGLFLPF